MHFVVRMGPVPFLRRWQTRYRMWCGLPGRLDGGVCPDAPNSDAGRECVARHDVRALRPLAGRASVGAIGNHVIPIGPAEEEPFGVIRGEFLIIDVTVSRRGAAQSSHRGIGIKSWWKRSGDYADWDLHRHGHGNV